METSNAGGIGVEVQEGGVAVVRMKMGENRFNPDLLDGLEAALDQIEAIEGPAALVLTGEGKFFSNGLDLEWLGAADDDGRRQTLGRVYDLFARLLEFPAPTVAAINGHVFAAGGMMALACDWRVMREDRGFFCLPEADIGLIFVPGMTALITHRLTHATARESMLTGRRYDAEEALRAGIVDRTASEADVLAESIAIAEPLAGKAKQVQQGIKRGLSAEPIAALRAEAETARGA
ncbi:MAG TPA: enoyl-CoA hydratase/isomerase family protein [Solirubrobacterales bacterium]|nr:enoyl-CoA hydratase/isomerase family protein [Solirubrobacterales bacterium]